MLQCLKTIKACIMRIKKKKHLKERLANASEYLIVAERDISNVIEAIKDKRYIDIDKVFSNENEVCLEIGCGKGGFVTEMAQLNKDKNFLAVEMLENIIVMAIENAKNKSLNNVRFINTGAEYLTRYIKDHTISTIYLNFSPPYPPKSYENRRLTNDRFISTYKQMLKEDGVIYQKTDDKDFFEYSKEKFIANGFKVEVLNADVQHDFVNVKTEYEKKFESIGLPIYRLVARL